MGAHEAYFAAVIPDPCTILGLDLKPFSAGHILLLHRAGSVFAIGGTATEEELAFAVYICAQDFKSGAASLNDPKTPKFLRKWRKKIGAFDLIDKKKAFENYVNAAWKFPLTYSPRGQAQHSITDLPFVHSVRCALKHYYHVSESEFWDMPWGLAQWDYYTIPVMEARGDLVEEDAISSARKFAEVDFKRANPHLFPTEVICQN